MANEYSDIDTIYDILVKKYGESNCTKYDNGTIEVRNQWGSQSYEHDRVFIPVGVNTSNMLSYLPGAGGSGNDATHLVSEIQNGSAPMDCIVSIAAECSDRYYSMSFANDVAATVGYSIDNVSLTTFSASGGPGFQRLEEYLEKFPDTTASMLVCDGFNCDNIKGNGYFKNIDTLIEKNIPIVMLGPNGNRMNGIIKDINNNTNLNVYTLYTSRPGHVAINSDSFDNGLQKYMLGIIDEPVSGSAVWNGCNYQLLKYDPENPNANSMGYVAISFDDKEFIDEINAFYNVNHVKPGADGSVASDLYIVGEAMNAIRESIRNNEALQGTSFQTSSTTTIPAGLLTAQQSVLGISAGVVNNLNAETELIANMANVIYQMDTDLASRAGDLTEGSSFMSVNASKINAQLETVINTNITNTLEIGNALFSPGSYTGGNVGKLCASDIHSMYNGGLCGALKANFDAEINDATTTKSKITSFQNTITSSSNFSGEMWNQVAHKLDQYSELMDLRVESMQTLETAYNAALKLLSDYMGDYNELDTSMLPELRDTIKELKANIEYAKSIITATHEETRLDANGNPYPITVYDYSAGTRAQAQQYINWAVEQAQLINKLINKLEGLPDIMSQAEQIVNDALTEIYSKYGVKASEVVTGSAASYIPPSNTSYESVRSKGLFDRREELQNKYGTYENYKNYTIVEDIDFDTDINGEYNQYTRREFSLRDSAVEKWGSYENYVLGVEKVNDPMFNKDMTDNGKTSEIDLSIPEENLIVKEEESEVPDSDAGTTQNTNPTPQPSYSPQSSYTPAPSSNPEPTPSTNNDKPEPEIPVDDEKIDVPEPSEDKDVVVDTPTVPDENQETPTPTPTPDVKPISTKPSGPSPSITKPSNPDPTPSLNVEAKPDEPGFIGSDGLYDGEVDDGVIVTPEVTPEIIPDDFVSPTEFLELGDDTPTVNGTVEVDSINTNNNEGSSIGKTIGIATAAAAVLGGSAYAAYEYQKKKAEKDGEDIYE